MGKIKENISIVLSLIAILTIGVPLIKKEKREREEKEMARKKEMAKYDEVEKFRQPMVKNGWSFQIGYLFKDATIDVGWEDVTYYMDYNSQEQGIQVFDSLFVEICKHHCDSLAPYRFTNQYNRVFKCSHASASITLTYEGMKHDIDGDVADESTIYITYTIPHKLGSIGEEWEQYLMAGNNERED